LFLVGPWDAAPHDLMLWGLGNKPLSQITVKHIALRLTRLRALDLHSSLYSPSQAVLPALWGQGADGAADPQAVHALAARQLRVYTARAAAVSTAAALAGRRRVPRPSDAELSAIYRQPWMQPSPPRAAPAERAALRGGVAAARTQPAAHEGDSADPLLQTGAGRPGWRAAWSQVHAAGRRRHHRAFAWALLHAALPCGAARVPFWPSEADGLAVAACCGNAACRPGPSAGVAARVGALETLLHALFDCPAVRPALRWAAALWVRVGGDGEPPLTTRVWLQGDAGAWKPRAPCLRGAWQTLRIAVLSAAWQLRCRRAAWGVQFSPAEVVAACVVDLRHIIAADWQRATSNVARAVGARPPRGEPEFDVAAFVSMWCSNGVFARVSCRQGAGPAMEFCLGEPSGELA